MDISEILEEEDNNLEDSNDELFEHFHLIVDKGQAPERIDKFLIQRLQHISRNKLQNAIKSGSVLVDQLPIKANYKIKGSQSISIVLPHPPKLSAHVIPQDIPLNIVYEDEEILIINKPAGLVVHPGLGNIDGTLVNGLAYYLNKNLPIKVGNLPNRPGLVHRIDKDTTGLMVIAKTEYAMSHLAKQFFDHSVIRTYHALIWGSLNPESGRIVGNLGRNPTNRLQMMVFDQEDQGKFAATNYKTLENFYYVSHIICQLETGRTHQIRAHMMSKGSPLFSDARYGGNKILKGTIFSKYRQFVENCFNICNRQALHARTLGFIHPKTGQNMLFECDLPMDFDALLTKWRKYITYRQID